MADPSVAAAAAGTAVPDAISRGRTVPGPRPAGPAGGPGVAAEAQRLAALYELHILDTPPEPAFDDLVNLAARLAQVPVAMVNLLDEDRQWFKAKVGLDVCSIPREGAFCEHVIRDDGELDVPDTRSDPRFRDHPMVTGEPHVRFYAGFPLRTASGSVPGTLCVVGFEPYRLSEDQKDSLRALARLVVVQLELRLSNAEQARELALRREAEAQLATSRREFRLLAEHSSDIITSLDRDGMVAYVSPSVEAVLGLARSDVVGRPVISFVHPQDAGTFAAAFQSALDGGTSTITVRAGELGPARDRWLEITLSALPGSPSGPGGVLSASRDVTDRVEAGERLALSERRFRSVYHDSPVGIVLCDEHLRIAEVNPALCRLLDRSESELIGSRHDAFVLLQDAAVPEPTARYQAGLALGDTFQRERQLGRGDGQIFWALISAVRVAGPDGQPWTLAHVQDITTRKNAEQALADSEANLTAIGRVTRRIQSGQDPRETILIAALDVGGAQTAVLFEKADDDDQILVVTSSAGISATGLRIALDEPSLTATVWRTGQQLFVPDVHAESKINSRLLALHVGSSLLWQPILTNDEVTAILAVTWAEPVLDLSDRSVTAVLLLADEAAVALEHDALLRRYEVLATTDPLTALPNRRSWDERIRLLLDRAERTGTELVVAIADVDHFKKYNDTYGHLAGDTLLLDIAGAARGALRSMDVLARWGGEEFAIALPGCTSAEAFVVLDRFRSAIPRGETISIGFVEWQPGLTPESLITHADHALYQAKKAGRNRVVQASRVAGGAQRGMERGS